MESISCNYLHCEANRLIFVSLKKKKKSVHPKCFTNIETLYYNSISHSSFSHIFFSLNNHVIAVRWKPFFVLITALIMISEQMQVLTQMFNVIHSLGYIDMMRRSRQAQQDIDFSFFLIGIVTKSPSEKSTLKTLFPQYIRKTLCVSNVH